MDNNNYSSDNNAITTVSYSAQIDEYNLYIAQVTASTEAQAALEMKLHKYVKKQKDTHNMLLNTVAMIKDQLMMIKLQKEGLINSLASKKSEVVELRKQLLLAREPKLDILEKRKNNLKELEEKWLKCKNRFERIPFIKMFVEKNNEVEIVKRDIDLITIKTEKIRFDINMKKSELVNMRNKKMIELADFVINKLPVILKNIQDETDSIKKLKIEKQSNTAVVNNKLLASDGTKLTSEAKKISIDIENTVSPSRNKACDTFVLPKLHLTDMDSVPINFTQNVSYNNTALPRGRLESFTTKKLNILKRANVTEKPDEINVSTYFFAKPKKVDGYTRKYSDKKMIRILEDVKLDTTGAYQIVSKLKPNQLHYVNVIEAGRSQDLNTNNPSEDNGNKQSTEVMEEIDKTKKVSQETILLPPTPFLNFTRINEQSTAVIEEIDATKKVSQDLILPPIQLLDLTQINEQSTAVIEEIDATKKVSQNLILPPIQFLDLPQIPQEKKVTFNNVVTIDLVSDDNDYIPQENDIVVNNTLSSQLNASTSSNDSYIKIKDFVFKKHNVNQSPEFTYTKNTVPMVTESKIVTSKFFDEKKEGNNTDSAKLQNMEIDNEDNSQPEQQEQEHENPAETIKQANTTFKKLFEDRESTQKDQAQSAVTSFANYIRDIPCSLNISMDTTGYEDDAGLPQCIDSSLLLSPKADDEMQTRSDNTVETQSQGMSSFLSGFKKTGFSMFGNSSANKPEADAQYQNNKFTFNFGGNEKIKRGGFFSMFQ